MKRFIYIIFATMLLLAGFPMSVSADTQEERIYLEDGSYYTETINSFPLYIKNAVSDANFKNSTLTRTYNSASGVAQWSFTLSGTFRYDGTSATCIATSCSTSILQSGWSCSSKSSHAVGNMAVGDVTMVKKLLGITIETRTAHLTLTCDANGNIS